MTEARFAQEAARGSFIRQPAFDYDILQQGDPDSWTFWTGRITRRSFLKLSAALGGLGALSLFSDERAVSASPNTQRISEIEVPPHPDYLRVTENPAGYPIGSVEFVNTLTTSYRGEGQRWHCSCWAAESSVAMKSLATIVAGLPVLTQETIMRAGRHNSTPRGGILGGFDGTFTHSVEQIRNSGYSISGPTVFNNGIPGHEEQHLGYGGDLNYTASLISSQAQGKIQTCYARSLSFEQLAENIKRGALVQITVPIGARAGYALGAYIRDYRFGSETVRTYVGAHDILVYGCVEWSDRGTIKRQFKISDSLGRYINPQVGYSGWTPTRADNNPIMQAWQTEVGGEAVVYAAPDVDLSSLTQYLVRFSGE